LILLKTILKSIWKNKLIAFFIIVQFTICFYASLEAFITYKAMNAEKDRLTKSFDINRTLHIVSNSSDQYLDNSAKFDEFIKEIHNIDGVEFVGSYYIDRNGGIADKKTDNLIVFIDYGMSKLYPLKVAEGRSFNKEDFEDAKEGVPVLVGAELKKMYKIGDKIKSEAYGIEYKIIGFLEKRQEFLDGQYICFANINLDNSIVGSSVNNPFRLWKIYFA